jgi:sulfur-carrier protein
MTFTMTHSILIFGPLTDITGQAQIEVTDIANTSHMIARLLELYPAFEHQKFAIAIDNQIVNGVTEIKEGSSIALLPPFSGG